MKLNSISWRRCETVKFSVEVLAAAEQVALAQADVAQHAVLGREAGAERQLAGGPLHHAGLDDHPVRRAARHRLDVDRLEEAEVAQRWCERRRAPC